MKKDFSAHKWGQHPCVRECKKRLSSFLPCAQGPLLVAVSGGADSVGLLYLLKYFFSEYSLFVLHFNHELRGQESERDEKFVYNLARELEIPIAVGRAPVRELAKKYKKSLEMQARDSRYRFFAEKARELKASFIAMGHHAGDQAELFFLRLLRGASLEGLKGMELCSGFPYPTKEPLYILRPLLGCTHEEIVDFLHQLQISWVEDSSNQCEDILRNKIRHQLLPLLEKEYRQGMTRALSRTMEILGDESHCLNESLAHTGEQPFESWHLALQRRAVASELIGLGLTPLFEQVDYLVHHPDKLHHCQGKLIYRKRGAAKLFFEEEFQSWDSQEVELLLPEKEMEVSQIELPEPCPLGMEWKILPIQSSVDLAAKPANIELFDADKVGRKILLRHWHMGDRFQSIGFHTPQKLQDLFVDQKISQILRHQLWMAQSEMGSLFWVQSLRIGDFAKLTSSTGRVLQLTLFLK